MRRVEEGAKEEERKGAEGLGTEERSGVEKREEEAEGFLLLMGVGLWGLVEEGEGKGEKESEKE